MISDAGKRVAAPWLALGFCVCLSVIAVATILSSSFANGSDVGGWAWAVPFICFLPGCFFFVGLAISRTQVEIVELRRQLAEVQENKAVAG